MHKIFGNGHLKFGKMKKALIKKKHFQQPVNCKANFFTNWIYYWQIRVFLTLCIFNKPNVWYLWDLKILAIKRWFLFNFTKNLQGHHIVVGGPKNHQTFTRYFFWLLLSKNCMVKFTAVFMCLLLSWSRGYSMKWSNNFDGP